MAATVPVFAARGLKKVYHMGEVDVHALRGVDLDLCQSEFVVILGPSGSGKSTLLNILGGLDVRSGAMFHVSPQRPRTRPGTVVPILNWRIALVPSADSISSAATAPESVAAMKTCNGA